MVFSTLLEAMMDAASIASDYQSKAADCSRLLREVRHQLEHLIDGAAVTLGTPIEGRVKALASIVEKQKSKERQISSVTDFTDLVGLRVTLLFHRDLRAVDALLHEIFDVVEREDAAERLEATKFGYQSLHYVLKVKGEWLPVPSFRGLADYVFELQLRTLAQHIWAVASHKLQYKRELSVPAPIRRSINRVSALLEMVDLEFDRVLSQREEYAKEPSESESILNVDLLTTVLDTLLPVKNRDDENEPYDELLAELAAVGIDTVGKLADLLTETKIARETMEARRAAEEPVDDPEASWDRTIARHEQGVYFTHAGLVRISMDEKFGDDEMRALRRKVRWSLA
jgi:ppGpp synthetase/RelA/SpoT-type nucleotidyltranferase